ncbi:hypothetical protein HYS49_00650 [Candidatus Woesearchaeota archaeon]|nr:hypothetical protein [Candidatus Woesearchaeota archaeon]
MGKKSLESQVNLSHSDVDNRTASVGPSFEEVVKYATTDGTIDIGKLEELEGRYGYNGGRGCDVKSGPCSCGAWHDEQNTATK